MMKRLSFLFLSLFLAGTAVLAGCGLESSDSDSGGTVTLTMTSWRTEDQAGYQKIIQAFNKKYPNIQVKFMPVKNTEYDTILNTRLKSGNAPDIIQLRPYAPGMKLAEAGYLEPISDLKGIDQFPARVIEAATGKDGKIYGVPLSVNSAQIFYNKKIFDKYGLEEPKTWDELIRIAETLKKNGVTPFAFGSKEAWLLSLSHAILGPAFYGGDAFVDDMLKGKARFTSDPFVKSVQAMKDLTPYFPKNYTGLGMDDIRTLFATEQAAMFIMGSWELVPVHDLNPNLDMGVFPTPPRAGGEPTITTWVDSAYGIYSKSPRKEEAKKFLEFMATEEFGKLFADTFQRVSAVPGVQTNHPLVNEMAQLSDEISTPYMMLVHFNEGNPTTKQELESSLQGMYLGKLTPRQVAQQLQKSADTWFKPSQQ